MSIDVRALRKWIEDQRQELLDKSFEAMNSGQFAGRMVGEMYATQAKAYEDVYDHITEMMKSAK